jgi:alpha-beta hydrolase superfamily lysophospholipase
MFQEVNPSTTRQLSFRYGKNNISGVLFPPQRRHPGGNSCIIICHGAFERKENFFEFCGRLSQNDICAAVIDMPGHGESTGEKFHIHIDHWVCAIRGAIDFLSSAPEIDPTRIGIFGFSSGGTAAVEATIVEPRIKALITLDATIRNYLNLTDTLIFISLNTIGKIKKKLTGSDLKLNLTHLLKTISAAYDPAVNEKIISDPNIRAAYAAFPFPGAAQCAFVDTIQRVSRIQIPTLIIHGKEDQVDSPQTARLFFDRLTCIKDLKLIDHSGHCGYMDSQKNQVMDLTIHWVKKHLSTHKAVSNDG